MTEIIINPDFNQNLVDNNGLPTQPFYTWIDQVTRALNSTPPLTGVGSPDGVVVASAGRWYVDINPSPSDIYYKSTGDEDTGWILC